MKLFHDKIMATLILAAGAVLITGACFALYMFLFARPNGSLATGQIKVGGTTFSIEIAASMAEKARGLSYRPSLADGHGMLFTFTSSTVQSFWMKDMNFPLDMIWIGGGKVLGFAENAAPQPGAALWSLKIYSSPDGTNQVLEVNAGTVAKDHIQVGDPVSVGI